jgi:hypothetical protein
MARPRSLAIAALSALAVLAMAALVPAQERQSSAGYPVTGSSRWRFRHQERRVKVVLLAGSIGAFRDQPYGRLLHEWCPNAEIQNLSHVGEGAPQLFSRFRNDVVRNPLVPIGAPNVSMWLLFGGGLNSVGSSARTNRSIRDLTMLAHQRGFGVVAMTLTPWGSQGEARWNGGRGLHLLRSTRNVVDFVLGRLDAVEALGHYRHERGAEATGPDAPWSAIERPEISIDLYDSALRDREAAPWPIDHVRRRLRSDPAWRRTVSDEEDFDARLESDATALAEAPRWFLKDEYRGFDHIHPNREGHRRIAEIACPWLPRSWGCQCPPREERE